MDGGDTECDGKVIPPKVRGCISRIFSARCMRRFRIKTSRYTEAQILAILRQAEGGMQVERCAASMA